MTEDPLADAPGRECVVCGGPHWYHRHLYPAVMHEMFAPRTDA